jgi:hypothetical protein
VRAILTRLREHGLRLKPAGEHVIVEPRSALTDELRTLIRSHKPAILRELANEAEERRRAIIQARDAAPLSDFRAAFVMGRLHLCGNCSRFIFGADPGALGHCQRFNLETAPFVPFWCAGFEVSRTPAAPDYLPDPDGARARAKEYLK